MIMFMPFFVISQAKYNNKTMHFLEKNVQIGLQFACQTSTDFHKKNWDRGIFLKKLIQIGLG